MSAPREPEAVLAELGAQLRQAWDHDAAAPAARRGEGRGRRVRGRGRRLGRRARAVIALVALGLVGGPAAVATQDALQSEPLPELPASVRPPGALAPDRTSGAVLIARGQEQGLPWRLSATACRFGNAVAVGVFLSVPGGGAGSTCDVGPTASAQRVQGYVDALAGRTWAFALLPGTARDAVLPDGHIVPAVPLDPAATGRGIPAGLRAVVVALPGVQAAPRLRIRGQDGRPLLTCTATGCSPTARPTT